MEWKGAEALLLTNYFENREKLNELKSMKGYLSRKGDIESDGEKYYDEEIAKLENKIVEFISGLDVQHLKSIIYMSLDMKDKQVLFPKEFIKQHDKITRELVIVTDSKTNERIESLSNILALNTYEDDKYVIFPADSVDSLIDESSQMSNCVRNYCLDVSNNKCQIYFMRYKDAINKSLVTI